MRGVAILAATALILVGSVWIVGAALDGSASASADEAAAEVSSSAQTIGDVTVDIRVVDEEAAAVRIDIAGPGGSRARAVVLDDRDQAEAISDWVQAGRQTTVPVPQARLAGGPVRVRAQVQEGDGPPVPGPTVLVARPVAPVEAEVVALVAGAGDRVALVFDDGVDPAAMRDVIATLRDRRASATFCLNGYAADRWDEALIEDLRSAIQDGTVESCSHGFSHRTGEETTLDEAGEDLDRNRTAIDEFLGVPSTPLYRPPYGRLSPGILEAAGERGYSHVLLWSVDPGDYLRPAPADIARAVVRDSQPGSITVLHLLQPTAQALPAIISGLRERGLEPVGAGRMIAGATRLAGEAEPDVTSGPDMVDPPEGESAGTR